MKCFRCEGMSVVDASAFNLLRDVLDDALLYLPLTGDEDNERLHIRILECLALLESMPID